MAFGRDGSIHPDENLLTAFAERTLAKSERQDVLEHLSSCRHCRDVVFLAQQAAAEEALQVAPAPDKSIAGGWWLGRRHWGIVLAGGAVAALLIATSLRLYHGVDRAQVPPSSVAGAKTPAAPANLPARKKDEMHIATSFSWSCRLATKRAAPDSHEGTSRLSVSHRKPARWIGNCIDLHRVG